MIAISQRRGKTTDMPAMATTCPTCGGPLEDYRQVLANHDGLVRDGVCFFWADNDYTCSNRAVRRARREEARARRAEWEGPR